MAINAIGAHVWRAVFILAYFGLHDTWGLREGPARTLRKVKNGL